MELAWFKNESLDPRKYIRIAYNGIVSDAYMKTSTKTYLERPRSTKPIKVSTPQLAAIYGRHVESHVVLTNDGYILTLHRLLLQKDTEPRNESVLLHHGLLGSSMDWFLREPNNSLPFLLSAAGYDVWLANGRGNTYSRAHHSINVDSQEFWKFSWQEMGEFDLPAVIDYILQVQDKLNYESTMSFVGHSIGATALLVTLSTFPHYNAFLRVGILLAPLAFMSNTKGPLRDLAPMALHPPDFVLEALEAREISPSTTIPGFLISMYCNNLDMLCANPLIFACGNLTQKTYMSDDFVTRLMNYIPSGGSTRIVLHYAQLIGTGKFHKFGDPNAEYPLREHVTLPIALFSSSHDLIAAVPDVDKLFVNISNPIKHFVFRDELISHTEFVWGSHMDVLLYKNILSLLSADYKNASGVA